MITAVILTLNEELHIERCLKSLKGIADKIIIVDSGSSDKTEEICSLHQVNFIRHQWINYATQFNYGIKLARAEGAEFILRIDADEYLDEELIAELYKFKADIPSFGDCAGFTVNRYISFCGRVIKYGGVLPINVIRFFRADKGVCENRWMDEHIIVDGKISNLKGSIIDENLNDINWWVKKHLWYAERECVDVFLSNEKNNLKNELNVGGNLFKRYLKNNVYNKLPLGIRPFIYWIYRYFLRLGFLDGKAGFFFHFFQGFWYRAMVDYKIYIISRYMNKTNCSWKDAVQFLFNIKV